LNGRTIANASHENDVLQHTQSLNEYNINGWRGNDTTQTNNSTKQAEKENTEASMEFHNEPDQKDVPRCAPTMMNPSAPNKRPLVSFELIFAFLVLATSFYLMTYSNTSMELKSGRLSWHFRNRTHVISYSYFDTMIPPTQKYHALQMT
jgi:hypothetical protein